MRVGVGLETKGRKEVQLRPSPSELEKRLAMGPEGKGMHTQVALLLPN